MKEYLQSEIKKCISSWDKSDIYVISLFVYNEDDNPCKPTVTLGYNTYTKFKSEIEYAWNEQEAKWNYACWLQNKELEFGTGDSKEIVKKWMNDHGFPYISTEEIYQHDDFCEDEFYYITQAFVNVLIEIVQELHKSGFIKEQFGKEIPILIHELEYYDEIAEQNLKANPPELSDELDDFVRFCTEA